jgi:hypothetical protein
MTDERPGLPVAGWYPDPAGSGRAQWWNGSSWTDDFSAAPVQALQASRPATPRSAGAANAPGSYAQGSPYANAVPYSGAPDALTAPAGTSPYTPYIWVLALLPLVDIVMTLIRSLAFEETLSQAMDPDAPIFRPDDVAQMAIGLLVLVVAILVIVLDYRALKRAGVPQPFHWAWGFFMLIGAPVYMIGRSVVARRRTGSGLAPMWVNIALMVIGLGIGLAIGFAAVGSVLENTDFS